MTGRLSLSRLAGLPADITKPAYDVSEVQPGIVHLGAGAFHRAHQAIYTDDLMCAQDPGGALDWGITAVSMRRPEVANALREQQGLYSVTEYDLEGRPALRVIGAIRESLVLAECPGAVAEAIARHETQVVSLTVTEKAYYRHHSGDGLDWTVAAVRDDLASPQPARTAIGALVAGLALRRQRNAGPLSVVCCDNLAENGAMLRQLCLDFAERWRPGLAAWIGDHVSFPSTMVDRITPAATPELIAATASALGCADAVPVACERFRQWVIEDDFAGSRPPWDHGGAQFVRDVRPFEDMKLRMLNASHSALAYLGLLAGREHVHEALAAPGFRAFIDATMRRELAPTVRGIAAAELAAYREALLRRFSSPRPAHHLAQIAEDGSQKLPIRVLAPLREQRTCGGESEGLVLIVAAWLSFVQRVAEGALPGPLKDPLADKLLAVVDTPKASACVQALDEVFGPELRADAGFLQRLDFWQQELGGADPGAALRHIAAARR
jgi:fructuronate reductase